VALVRKETMERLSGHMAIIHLHSQTSISWSDQLYILPLSSSSVLDTRSIPHVPTFPTAPICGELDLLEMMNDKCDLDPDVSMTYQTRNVTTRPSAHPRRISPISPLSRTMLPPPAASPRGIGAPA
jgi:hypothetical protein